MGMRKKGPVGNPKEINFKALGRTIKKFFSLYPVSATIVFVSVIVAGVANSLPSIYIQKILASVGKYYQAGDWQGCFPEVIQYLMKLVVLYIIVIVAIIIYTQLMATMTHKFINVLRKEMFAKMQSLPIRYFDTNQPGAIMSYYTNDIDLLRQLLSQTLPQFIQSGMIVIMVVGIMCYYSIWLMLIMALGIFFMFFVSMRVGKGSAKYFARQQKAVANTEGYIEEIMNGEKIVKVFCHEEDAVEQFDRINDEWCNSAYKANSFANILAPIIQNIGNIVYVLIALAGGIFIALNVGNFSFSGRILDCTILVPFLNMTKQFTGNVGQLSQQLNSIVMASAGANRIFELLEQEAETDDGYVTLVNAKEDADGNLIETNERTGKWAWRHPHKADSTVTYQKLNGQVKFYGVDFSYEPEKQVLSNISLYAYPGQKVAFVGATGAGKTTITNLINRFYDIEDGKIRYDDININKIKKSDLRRSLGLVLQETNLFTGTVIDNIRYGRLDASDEECINAAKLVGADDFITRMPQGYNTVLSNNGSNLSQGQRQLIAISRAAVSDPPVMILDEATSSIDTRSEMIVQKGMDKLMEGRTVFVIAHRLSTVKNADVIMVLDKGEIIERGTHEQLIEQRGAYYNLYSGTLELQ